MLRPWKLFLILLSVAVCSLICYFVFLSRQDSLIYSLEEAAPLQNEVINLGKLNIIKDRVTLSGFSAGASMATQLHVAYSSLFSGVAIFSQVFYRCGPSNIISFGLRCSKYFPQWFPYKVESSVEDARNYEKEGLIDPLKNLENQRVFIWTGALDEYIPLDLAKQNKDFYDNFIPNHQELISLNVESNAKHLFPTTNYGDACDEEAGKNVYLGNCSYSGAYHSLRFLLGEENVTRGSNSSYFSPSSLKLFNQFQFYEGKNINDVAMGNMGFIYIPKKCEEEGRKCFLHINFHGCNEYPPSVAKRYIENNEFLPVAEENGIIVVFPLSTKVPSNMEGCWDFYSYTGSNFATRKGKQITVVRNIIQRLLRGTEEQLLID